MREVPAEAESHRSKTTGCCGCCRYLLYLEAVGLIAIKTDQRDERPGSRGRLPTRLKIDIHLPLLAEVSLYTRDQLLSVYYEGVAAACVT